MRRSEGRADVTETRLRSCAAVLGTIGWLAVSTLPVHAVTLYVGNNGSDAFFPPCGAQTTPCRSISKGISLANPNDTILVGPGVYGDLNGNGTFEPASGEENAEIGSGCECMVKVDIPLTIKSRDGARVTVLDAAGLTQNVVHIVASAADGASFGKPNHGFTVRRGTVNGVLTDSSAQKVKVQGNIATGNVNGFNISGNGGGLNKMKALDNIARDNSGDGFLFGGTSNALQRNRAVRNGIGFAIGGTTHTVTQNVGSRNSSSGFRITFAGSITTPVTTFSNNSGIANGVSGIDVQGDASLTVDPTIFIKRTNLYGNGDAANNCGLTINNASTHLVTVKTPQVFWGNTSNGQPGPNPADGISGLCFANTGGGSSLLDYSFAVPKEFGVSEPALK